MAASRRDFIRTVLLASGTVLVSWDDVRAIAGKTPTKYSTLNFEKVHAFLRDKDKKPVFPDSEKKFDVVIVGAGPAGIAAAWRLREDGQSVLVLDNEEAAGGVMRNPAPDWKGIAYPLGASYFYNFSGPSAQFFKALKTKPLATGEDALYIGKDDIAVDWWNPEKLKGIAISPMDQEVFIKFADKIRKTEIPPYPIRNVPVDTIRKFDALRAKSFVQDFGSDFLTEILSLYSLSTFGVGLDEINLYSFLAFYARELGAGAGGECYTFASGPGELASRAVDIIGSGRFHMNAAVINVNNFDDGTADVNYVDTVSGQLHTVSARAVVMAIPRRMASSIIAKLPTVRASAMRAIRYAPYVTISLCCNGPLFAKRAFSFWLGDQKRLFTDVIDITSPVDAASGNSNRSTGPFVYQMCCPRPERDRANLLDTAWLAKFAQDAVDALALQVPNVRSIVEELHVFSWGHSMVIPAVGSYQNILPYINAPFGSVYFTGADNDLAPSINNAVDAAIDTAQLVIAKLK